MFLFLDEKSNDLNVIILEQGVQFFMLMFILKQGGC